MAARTGFISSMVRMVISGGPSVRIVSTYTFSTLSSLSTNHVQNTNTRHSPKTTAHAVQPSLSPTRPAINASPSYPAHRPVRRPLATVRITHAPSAHVPTHAPSSRCNFATRTSAASPRVRIKSRMRCRRASATCRCFSRLASCSPQAGAARRWVRSGA